MLRSPQFLERSGDAAVALRDPLSGRLKVHLQPLRAEQGAHLDRSRGVAGSRDTADLTRGRVDQRNWVDRLWLEEQSGCRGFPLAWE
jgi:hypothetical protein